MEMRLLRPALLELQEAADWYLSKSREVERRFLVEIGTARDRIVAHPHAWHPLGPGIRRYRLTHFPYGLIYAIEGDEIVVLAVAHLHRDPWYWRDRLSMVRPK